MPVFPQITALWIVVQLLFTSALPMPYQQAQQNLTLRYGIARQARLQDTPQRWIFEGRKGDRVMVDMMSVGFSELDPHLTLQAPDGAFVAEDDDSGSALNARLINIELPDSGQYTLIAASALGIGDYVIQVQSLSNLPILVAGKPLAAQLDLLHPALHFRLDPSPDIPFWHIEARAATSTPRILLYNLKTNDFASNASYRNSNVIDPFIPEPATEYLLTLEGVLTNDTSAQTFDLLVDLSDISLLEDNRAITGTVGNNEVVYHYFLAQAGDTVTIQADVLSGDISLSIYIRDIEGQVFVGASRGSAIRALALTAIIMEDGYYLIELEDGSYSTNSGQYELRFERSPSDG